MLETVGRLLDQAIDQAGDERHAETLRDLLKDARLELARLEDAMSATSTGGRRKSLDWS